VSWRRLLAAGVIATAVVGVGGRLLELSRFGRTDDRAVARVHQHVREGFDGMVAALSSVSSQVASDPAAAAGLAAGPEGARTLFDLADRVRSSSAAPDEISVTIYDEISREARAWAGRPSDIPRERIAGPSAIFVTQAPLGLRLVHVQPVMAANGRRSGAVAAEHVLSPAPAPTAIGPADYTIDTPLAPASLRLRFDAADRERSGTLLLREPSGRPLIEVDVDRAALGDARAAWRRRVLGTAVAVFGITLFLLVGPLLDGRAVARDPRTYRRGTVLAVVLTATGGALLWRALVQSAGGRLAMPITVLLAGATGAAIAALLAGPAARLRVALWHRRMFAASARLRFGATQLLAGAVVAAMVTLFDILLDRAVDPVTVDLRHLSLHPWGDGTRILLLAGIFAVHLAVLWGGTLTLAAALAPWRLPRRGSRPRLLVLALWLAPGAVSAAVAVAREWPVSALGLALSVFACAVAALFGSRLVTWYRRTTVAARILALFLAFLAPALLLYPTLDFFAERATRRLIATQYAVQAQNHVQTLLDRLAEAQRQIDEMAILPDLVTGAAASAGALGTPTDSAFFVWRQTALARGRLTSAVELYGVNGALVSRFALNIPEYTVASPAPQMTPGCAWDVFGEVTPFGSEERRMLHAERRICTAAGEEGPLEPKGAIILHVVLEYETLPFISSQNPYFEVFRPTHMSVAPEGTTGGNVEVAIYGWGLQPLYTSGRSVWPLTDELFARIYASREPFWAEVRTPGVRHQVYFSNDRDRIFAIGYPVLSAFDHFVHLAELTTLAAVGFALVLLGTAAFTRIGREQPRVGRALLREIRASFYRKLFLAFVLAAILPVLTLAFVIRTYFANLMRSDVEAEAARTAITARRVIEEADAPLRRTTEGEVGSFSDDVMIWISQVIDQDVNVFLGPRLAATSERDLFASGLLPTRTPVDVYRAIVLQRLPSYVGEDQIGDLPYMLAAAPVRAADGNGVLTVPLGNRQREIDREIDDLDRGVHLASVFFILLGAGIGLSMAERIADPVRRLTRATRRIARGDFDERIAVRSADELKRLVDAFNSMAAELKAQRAQLERTHRLEAWAEMARQVAHEIKNPLTPIQLSAEHLQRVHADRGEPMGPVLDSCVSAILGQVRLLRQISAEFSSFASSPTARPSEVDLAPLIAEVVDPYRTGLAGRIAIANQATAPLPHVFADRTLVARALSNIVENALHAMPGAGVLNIDASVNDGFVAVTVRDTGVGMDEDALARVFEPYFSTKTTGTGLGLTIARRNVELSGGTIDVKSVKGQGTAVTIALPAAAVK
jgi:signal transduction histidine kinase/MFS family permease